MLNPKNPTKTPERPAGKDEAKMLSDLQASTEVKEEPGFFAFLKNNLKTARTQNPQDGTLSQLKKIYQAYGEEKQFRQQKLNTYSSIANAAKLNKEFLALLLGSCLIATFGLIAGSTAVIIGAMLIAPLMMPILGFALSVIWGDKSLLWTSLRTLGAGSLLVLALSTLISALLPGLEFNSELMGRINPSLFDILIAIASGLVGAYAYVNPNISNSISGVAIAVALMPPLCTVGISLGQGEVRYALGATLLYLINLIGISLAASIVFWRTRVHPSSEDSEKVKGRAIQNVVLSVLLLVLIAIPIGYFTFETFQMKILEKKIRQTIIQISPHSEILQLKLLRIGNTIKVKAVFLVGASASAANIEKAESEIRLLLENQTTEIDLFPVRMAEFRTHPTP